MLGLQSTITVQVVRKIQYLVCKILNITYKVSTLKCFKSYVKNNKTTIQNDEYKLFIV